MSDLSDGSGSGSGCCFSLAHSLSCHVCHVCHVSGLAHVK